MPDQSMLAQHTLDRESELSVLESHIHEALDRARKAGASDADLSGLLQSIWRGRIDRYSEQRGHKRADEQRIEMYRMGG